MPINCIAVDDDACSLENLVAYMDELPALKLLKTFTDPMQAITNISADDQIDIIFMDIEMPVISGIELAGLLRKKTKYLIFTTAHTKYAIDAFSVDADAYLLKPYSLGHLTDAVKKLYPEQDVTLFKGDEFFFIPADQKNGMVKIDFNELIAIEKINETLQLRTLKHTYTDLKISYNKMLSILKRHPAFIQVNAFAIISKLHIKSVLDKQIILAGGISITLSHKYQDSLFAFIRQNQVKDQVLKD